MQINSELSCVVKRNAKALSLNAIVDVCRRRHEMIFLISRKLLQTTSSKNLPQCSQGQSLHFRLEMTS